MESSTDIATPLPTHALSSNALSTSALPAELSDAEILTATRRLVGRSNQLLASLLAHLAAVEARGLHRTRACASLYTYCIYELRFSEDEAFRRVAAARLVRRFPVLFDALAAGELHLTGLLMLGPHLTADNFAEVLTLAKHRTKKELARLVRRLDPPEAPARIEPLGPAPAPPAQVVSSAPTWSQLTSAANLVRELAPGAAPRDWTASAGLANDGANDGASLQPLGGTLEAEAELEAVPEPEPKLKLEPEAHPEPAPARRQPLEPQRYKVQFEASEEYVALVERAKALLSHAAPRIELGELHLRAMRALVAELEREKYAVTARQRQRQPQRPRQRVPASSVADSPHERLGAAGPADEREGAPLEAVSKPEYPRRRGRHVPVAIWRAVFGRDQRRCTYRSDSGERCRETERLELHHLSPFARAASTAWTTSPSAAALTIPWPPSRISAALSSLAPATRATTSHGPRTTCCRALRQRIQRTTRRGRQNGSSTLRTSRSLRAPIVDCTRGGCPPDVPDPDLREVSPIKSAHRGPCGAPRAQRGRPLRGLP